MSTPDILTLSESQLATLEYEGLTIPRNCPICAVRLVRTVDIRGRRVSLEHGGNPAWAITYTFEEFQASGDVLVWQWAKDVHQKLDQDAGYRDRAAIRAIPQRCPECKVRVRSDIDLINRQVLLGHGLIMKSFALSDMTYRDGLALQEWFADIHASAQIEAAKQEALPPATIAESLPEYGRLREGNWVSVGQRSMKIVMIDRAAADRCYLSLQSDKGDRCTVEAFSRDITEWLMADGRYWQRAGEPDTAREPLFEELAGDLEKEMQGVLDTSKIMTSTEGLDGPSVIRRPLMLGRPETVTATPIQSFADLTDEQARAWNLMRTVIDRPNQQVAWDAETVDYRPSSPSRRTLGKCQHCRKLVQTLATNELRNVEITHGTDRWTVPQRVFQDNDDRRIMLIIGQWLDALHMVERSPILDEPEVPTVPKRVFYLEVES